MLITRNKKGIVFSCIQKDVGEVTYDDILSDFYSKMKITPEMVETVTAELSVNSDLIVHDDKVLKEFVSKYFNIDKSEIEIL